MARGGGHTSPFVPVGPPGAAPVGAPAPLPAAPPVAAGLAPGAPIVQPPSPVELLRGPDGAEVHAARVDVPDLLAQGFTQVDPAEVAKIEAARKHKGLLSALGAAGTGAVETLVPVVGPAAMDLLGHSYDEQRELKEAHPFATPVGQVAGAVAPALLTFGASAPVSAGGVAAGTAVRAAARASAPEVLATIGGKVAAGVEAAAGQNALGRIAGSAANMAVQSASFTAADWANRRVQRDPKATAEQLFHQGVGAVIFGGALGALGGAMTKAAGAHAGDFIGELRELEARGGLKATGAIQGLIGKWEKQVGPERLKEIGRALGREGGVGPFKSFEEMLQLAETRFKGPAAVEMEQLLKAASTGKPGSVAFIDEIFNKLWQDPMIRRWRRNPLDREAFAKFKGTMDDLLDEYVVRNTDGTIRHYRQITPETLHTLSQSFAKKARGYTGQVDPSSEAFREAYDAGRVAVNERLESLMETVSQNQGGLAGKAMEAWKAAKFRYQAGLFLEDGATLGWKRSWGNNQISPMEAIGAMTGAVTGQAPGAAILGTAVGIVRREGSSLENLAARRTADFFERMQQQSGQKIEESLLRIFRGAGAEAAAQIADTSKRHEITAATYGAHSASIWRAANDPESVAQRIAQNFGPLVEADGEVALALQQTASQAAHHLAKQLPSFQKAGLLDSDYVPSPTELANLNRHWRVTHAPETVLDKIAEGTFTVADSEALAAIYPSLLPVLKTQVAEALAEAVAKKEPISNASRMGLSQFLGIPLSSYTSGATIAAVQAAHEAQSMKARQGAAPEKNVNFKSSEQVATATQGRASRLDRGQA